MNEEKFKISIKGEKAIPKTKKGKINNFLKKKIPLIIFIAFLVYFVLVFTPTVFTLGGLKFFTNTDTGILDYIFKIMSFPILLALMSILPLLIISFICLILENDKDFDYQYTIISPYQVVDTMNRIVQLENGKLLPKYKFIDWEKSKIDMIVLSIPLDSDNQPLKQIDNKHVENPETKEDYEQNAFVDVFRKSFEYMGDEEFTHHYQKHINATIEANQLVKMEAYKNQKDLLMKNGELTQEELNNTTDMQSLKSIKNKIDALKTKSKDETN